MEILTQSVAPRYAQLAVFDPDQTDSYPDWGDGDDEIATTDYGVAIATIPDTRGRVLVRVVSGGPPTPDARVVFQGSIRTSAGRMLVGSVTGAELFEFRVEVGVHALRIESTSPPDEVDNLTIHIE